jgi:hypothetical protein
LGEQEVAGGSLWAVGEQQLTTAYKPSLLLESSGLCRPLALVLQASRTYLLACPLTTLFDRRSMQPFKLLKKKSVTEGI